MTNEAECYMQCLYPLRHHETHTKLLKGRCSVKEGWYRNINTPSKANVPIQLRGTKLSIKFKNKRNKSVGLIVRTGGMARGLSSLHLDGD